jgi:hypothetical protein
MAGDGGGAENLPARKVCLTQNYHNNVFTNYLKLPPLYPDRQHPKHQACQQKCVSFADFCVWKIETT